MKHNKSQEDMNTEEKLLKQGMKLFLQKGYHGTSIDDITQACGMTKGALYWHFSSKEDLLKKILNEFEREFLDGLISAVKETKGGGFDKLDKLIRFAVAFAYYNRETCVSFATLSTEFIGANHNVEPKIRRIYNKYRKFLSNLIARGKRENLFKEDIKPDLAARVIIAAQDGMLLHWSMDGKHFDNKSFVNTYKRILFNGLIK